MKKRFLGILLCLCMVLSLMPATVFAEETMYDLWIGSERFTSGKKTISVGGGTATFDPDNSKLTLNNITLTYNAESMSAIQSDISDIQIELIGTNTINIARDGMAGIWLDSSSKATITGTSGSKLIINSSGKENVGITTSSGVSLTMNNTNLTVNDNTTTATAKGYMVGLKLGGDLTMTGGSYTAVGVQNGIEMYTNCAANLSGVSFNISCTPRQSFNSTIPNEMSIGLCLAPLSTGRQNVITNCSGSISAHYPLYTDGLTALNTSNNLTLTTDNYDAVYANADLTVSGGILNLTSTGSSGSGFSVLKSSRLVFDGAPNVTVNVGYVAVYLVGDTASAKINSGTLNTTARAGVLLSKAGNTFTLAGGTLEMTPKAGESPSLGIQSYGTVSIEGGSLKTAAGMYSAIQNVGTKPFSFSGGTHTLSNSAGTGSGYLDTADGTLNISGTADVTFDGWSDGMDVHGALNLSGGKLTVSNAQYGIDTYGTLNLTGGTLNTSGTLVGVLTEDGGLVKFAGTDATLAGETAGWAKTSGTGAYSVTGGKVVFKGGSYAAGTIYSSLAAGYSVYAGTSESDATRIVSPSGATFVNNKYVRIEANVAVTGVTIDETLSVITGETKTPSYTVTPANATNKAVSFTSSDPTVATVNAATGEVTGVKKGTATITITTEEGNFTDTCTVTVSCGHTHKTDVSAKSSTCKEQGWDAYSVCDDCGQLLDKDGNEISAIPYLPLAEHTESGWQGDAEGHWKVCTICGAITTAKEEHVPDHEGNATEEYAIKCKECGWEMEAQLGHTHSLSKVEATTPTCTEDGNIEYYKCSVCGKLFADADAESEIKEADVVVKTDGHQYEWIVDKEATETEAGSKHEECKVCHDAKDPVEIPPVGTQTEKLQNLLNAGGKVTLDQDYILSKTLEISKDVTLDLNGHVIKMTGSGSVLQINFKKSLTLEDSNTTAAHSGLPDGGVITGGNASIGGGLYIAHSGSFTMNGGTIYNCASSIGGGVYCDAYSNFTMNGGTIDNCTATSNGGGVAIMEKNSLFTMNDGAIRNCSGGGVYGGTGSTFTMEGGIIEGCTSGNKQANGIMVGKVMNANGGIVKDTVAGGTIESTSSDGGTRFYGAVFNSGTINGGIYYGQFQNFYGTINGGIYYGSLQNSYGTINGGIYYSGIVNKNGTINGTYYTVSFDLNGGSGFITSQLFVNISTGMALKPGDPTWYKHAFAGWYNGDTKYDFTEAVTGDITLKAKWISGNVSSEAGLQEALDAGITSLRLSGDIQLATPLDLSDKSLTLDLNGHTLAGNIKLSDTSADPDSILTLVDSNPAGGGVLDGSIELTGESGSVSRLYANGGTVTGMVSMTGNAGGIFCTSGTPTVFKGYAGDLGEIHGGIFYGGIQKNSIRENSVTFLKDGQAYAIEVVAAGSKVAAPIEPSVPEGMKFTGWYTDDAFTEQYELGADLHESITLYAGIMPITYTITYDPGEYGEGDVKTDVKVHGVDLTLPGETFTREGYVQTGWSYTDGGDLAFEPGENYSMDEAVTLYPVWDEIVTLTVDFTTSVTLGDNGVPGETVFTLEIMDANAGEETYADVTVSGSVATNGAGSYEGVMTFTGPFGQLKKMLCEGAFVQQVDAGEEGWTYDDTVWGLCLEENIIALLSLEDVPEYILNIYPTICEETDDGTAYYHLDQNAEPLDEMSFVNVYTAHVHDYTQKHDETDHWDECGCNDVQNKEAHKYGDWKVTKEATETARGEKEHTCTVCGYTETAEITKLPAADTPKPTESNPDTGAAKSPQTGDNSMMWIWFVLLFVSGTGIAEAAVYSKRKKAE